jgi:hypothetical protein
VIPVDLRTDGLLWLINTTVFHPRGFALAMDVKSGALSLMGDGTEPWSYMTTEQHPDNPGALDVDALFAATQDLFERAARENATKEAD